MKRKKVIKADQYKIPLEALPKWAQSLIADTALWLLEDEEAYAIWCYNCYEIYAHGFIYTCKYGTNRVF